MIILQISAVVLATLFAGAALYITLVEHPARMVLDQGPLLSQWQVSYKRALPIQSGLAIAAGVAGIAVWFFTGHWQWIAGSVAILANWPFTLLVIMSVNRRLMAWPIGDANGESRAMLERWGGLHAVRGALGMAATVLFAWALAVSV